VAVGSTRVFASQCRAQRESPFDVSPKGCDLKHKLAVRLSRLNEHGIKILRLSRSTYTEVVRRPPGMSDVLFGWSQFHASRAFAMLPSVDLYGAPRGTSNVADLRVTRYPSNDEVATSQDLRSAPPLELGTSGDYSAGTDRYLSDVSNPSWQALEPQGRCRSGSSTAPSFRLSFSRCCSRRLKWPRAVAANLASLSIRAVAVSPGMVFGLHGELSAQSILDGHSTT
jgi:hypothetical protein